MPPSSVWSEDGGSMDLQEDLDLKILIGISLLITLN
jgi:hypothetical protein